jgi:hypothetical protein
VKSDTWLNERSEEREEKIERLARNRRKQGFSIGWRGKKETMLN